MFKCSDGHFGKCILYLNAINGIFVKYCTKEGIHMNFIDQITKDIREIQTDYQYIDERLNNDYFAFYYWLLKYLYHIDIEDDNFYFIKDSDGSYCCLKWYKDEKELYIIKGLFVTENKIHTVNPSDFLSNDLLSRLFNNNTVTIECINEILTDIIGNKDYSVYQRFYITRPKNTLPKSFFDSFEEHRKTSSFEYSIMSKLITLEEIEAEYNDIDLYKDIEFKHDFTLLKKHVIRMDAEENNREFNVDTVYFAIEVYDILQMVESGEKKHYDLFDENIREYLGIKGKNGKVNKGIRQTLLDPIEHNRFFYYNNGVTIICRHLEINKNGSNKWCVSVVNPKVVNGCQTVNTIAYAIRESLEKQTISETKKFFKHTKVLVKIFQVDKNIEAEKNIYSNIVKYTNSQTGISAKDFTSRHEYFMKIQEEFFKYGFYLIIKQSDTNTFENDKELYIHNKERAQERYNLILHESPTKPKDLFIPLDKLLRVLMAFYYTGYEAFHYSASLLKDNSKYYLNFSKHIREFFSIEHMINLYLYFVKTGGIKPGREKYPVPYYMLDFLGRYIKDDDEKKYSIQKVNQKLDYLFSSNEILEQIFEAFKAINEDYCDEFKEEYHVEYANMTKNKKIDSDMLDKFFMSKQKEAKRHNMNYFLEYIK